MHPNIMFSGLLEQRSTKKDAHNSMTTVALLVMLRPDSSAEAKFDIIVQMKLFSVPIYLQAKSNGHAQSMSLVTSVGLCFGHAYSPTLFFFFFPSKKECPAAWTGKWLFCGLWF